MSTKLVVAAGACAVRGKDRVLISAGGETAVELAGDSGELAWELMAFLRHPRERSEIIDHVRAMVEADFEERLVDELLAELVRSGGVVSSASLPHRPVRAIRRRAVICVTGAIAAVEAPRAVASLEARGFEVWVAMTESARRFVSEMALASLTHHPVVTSLWDGSSGAPVPHLTLAEWADVVVVYPASATTIARLASGDFSEVVSAIALSTTAPVIVAPSMNSAMLDSPAVMRNLETLDGDGFFVMAPRFGVEVAERPGERTPRIGAAPSPDTVAAMAQLIAERHPRPPRPGAPIDWEAIYRNAEAPPWESEEMADDLRQAIAKIELPASLLDLGAGLGTVAIAAARMGFRVVATDASMAALERARARDGASLVTFVHDDVRRTSLRGSFDVVVDRGCLHCLPASELAAYADSLERVLSRGGYLLAIHDGTEASKERSTSRIAPDDLARLLGLTLESAVRTTLVAADPNTSWLSILVRR